MINTNMPSVEGAKGTKPTLTFPETEAPEGLQVQVLDAGAPGGRGRRHDRGQLPGPDLGGDVFDNSYDRGQPLNFQVGVGHGHPRLGRRPRGPARRLAACCCPPLRARYGDRGVPQAGIRGGDTLVFVTEILGVM